MDLYLIDGSSYVYRAFFAIRGLTDSKGRPTNAIFGFTRMLLKIIEEKSPDGLIVSFDTPHPTERHVLFEDYKAQRPETPDDLIAQLPHIKRVLEAFRIKVLDKPGYEADDVLATLAERAAKKGMDVYIVTGDKDMLQLVDDRVKVYDPMKDRILDEAYVNERFGLPPERVTEYMALVGDAVDNIPGVKGVGDKTARELLTEFASLEELMAHPERIKKDRIRKLVSEGTENIILSKRLAEINREVPLDVHEDDFVMKEPDWDALLELFREMEFTSLVSLIPERPSEEREYETVLELGRLRELADSIQGEFGFDTETTGRDPMRDTLVGFSLSAERNRAAYVPLMHSYMGAPAQVEKGEALGAVREVLENPSFPKIGHNLKFDILVMRREGIELSGRLYDTMLASYLLNPLRFDHSLETVGLEHLSRKKKSYTEVAGKGGFQDVELKAATAYAADDAEIALELKDVLFEKLRDEGLEEVYREIDEPLIRVLAEMEEAGMKIDGERLSEMGKELDRELDALQTRIFFLAGEEFNINSPKQLANVLFEKLGLKPGKKKKTGYSTDVGVLEELAKTHELPLEVLAWRSLSKLKNTYVDVLPRLVNPDTGRLHTSFNQTVTATGRLSSSEPNLQNIPIRGDWGVRVREAFIADEGKQLLSADYSQIELRILAHLCQDESLVHAFSNGVDVHTRTAAEIFDVAEKNVTQDMRRVAKTVNFGVIYGMSPFGLSDALGITKAEAERYINSYFQRHPGVNAYITHVIDEARTLGYVRTISGRKRPVPELSSRNANVRLLGQRLAVNSPIQGTAADIIKLAMIRIAEGLRERNLHAKMILQVHDELLFEVPEEETDEMRELVRELMEGAMPLQVPLRVEIGTGKNWAEAH